MSNNRITLIVFFMISNSFLSKAENGFSVLICAARISSDNCNLPLITCCDFYLFDCNR